MWLFAFKLKLSEMKGSVLNEPQFKHSITSAQLVTAILDYDD